MIEQTATEMDEYRFLPLHEVSERVGLSRSTIYRLMGDGLFPRPINLTERRVAFIESEIVAWQREKVEDARRLADTRHVGPFG